MPCGVGLKLIVCFCAPASLWGLYWAPASRRIRPADARKRLRDGGPVVVRPRRGSEAEEHVPRDHGSRGAPAARNCLPDGGKQSWEILRNLHGEHSCTQRGARGRLLAMGSSRTAVRGTRTRIATVLATLIRTVGGVIVLIM